MNPPNSNNAEKRPHDAASARKPRKVARHKLTSHLVCSYETARQVSAAVATIQTKSNKLYSKETLVNTILDAVIPEVIDAIIKHENGCPAEVTLTISFSPPRIAANRKEGARGDAALKSPIINRRYKRSETQQCPDTPRDLGTKELAQAESILETKKQQQGLLPY
jgi:hypothetical protein